MCLQYVNHFQFLIIYTVRFPSLFLLLFGNEMIYEFECCFSFQDCNEDGELSLTEFSDLIDAFGNKLAAEKVRI